MCGIAGLLGEPDAGVAADAVRRMMRELRHRGPDDEGVEAWTGIAYGMTRLSIIDLPGGHQPMVTESGVGIVFNGEIYNYRELRRQLEREGVRFETQSDTEVLLRWYEARGIAGLAALQGMFAVCIHDGPARRVHLIRDRLGIKPLYYAKREDRIWFGSEVKALLAAMPTRPALNLTALDHYLTFRFVPAPLTPWEGIVHLPPGHRLAIDLETGRAEEVRWWTVDFVSDEEANSRDYVHEFEHLFHAAVEKRLVAADVPVGVLLSGGLDSSAVGAAAVELGHRAFHTFSVAFADGGQYDERTYARLVADQIGSTHHEVVIGRSEFLDFLPELVYFTDAPLADLASIPLFHVSRLAREHVKVVLAGEGSDEILAGYDLDSVMGSLERLRRVAGLPRVLLRSAGQVIPGERGAVLRALGGRRGWSGLFSDRGVHMTKVFSETEKRAIWRHPLTGESSAALIADWYAQCASSHPMDQLQTVYTGAWLADDLLAKADRMSMANSLELRVPFLDHDLVEWAAALPLAWKVGNRQVGYRSKRILREYASRRLPAVVLERPKQGFPVPAYGWVTGDLGLQMSKRVFGAGSRLADLFDLTALQGLGNEVASGDAQAAHKLWSLIVLDCWLERWL